MRYCSSCGHELGVGRFCTNCGQPIDRTGAAPAAAAASRGAPSTAPPSGSARVAGPTGADTEERRAARLDAAMVPSPPRTPPLAGDTPAPPRFPLYADEVGPARPGPTTPADPSARHQADQPTGAAATRSGGQHAGPPSTEEAGGFLDRFGRPDETRGDRTPQEALAALNAAADSDGDVDRDHHRRGPWVLAAVLVVVVVTALLVWLGTRDGASNGATDPSGGDGASAQATEAADLAPEAEVEVPGTAPDAREASGGTATFVAANMLDGDPTTAWRVAGSASGSSITFTFPQPVTISQVGLINGYAKTGVGRGGKRFDWYHGNRTIAKVAWVFDDDTTLDQTLERNRRMQTLDVDDVTTSSITLRIVDVRSPGSGRASRNFTAISDVSLVGLPAR